MMKVAVLGGGHGGHAAAVEMIERGHEVWFWRRDTSALRSLSNDPRITLTDFRGTREVAIDHVCEDLAEAVAQAELILSPLPATAQRDLAAQLAPLLKSGQVMFIPPGTFGSTIFSNAMRDCGNRAEVAFAETGTLPNLVRKHGPRQVVVSAYAKHLPTGVFPARLGSDAFAILRAAYPSIQPIEDVLSAALMNAGPIIHPPLILMNAGPLQHFPAWDIHNEGTQPAIRQVTDRLDEERVALREALGYAAPHFPLRDHYASSGPEWMYGRAAHDRLTKSGDWREKIDLQTHRYMLEDTRLGLSFLASVAAWAGVPAPIATSLLALARTVVGEQFDRDARTLASLGLSALTRDQMRELLWEGR